MAKKSKPAKRHYHEDPVRLSESVVWNLQRDYYARQGAKAWTGGDVPFWITSNPYIARIYARTAVAFLEDLLRTGPHRVEDGPINVVELGSGSGQHAWHLVRELKKECRLAGLPENSFRVILTDFTQNNIDAWRTKAVWSAHLASGAADFAIFDTDSPGTLELQVSGERLSGRSTPVVLIANYLFDTIRQDAFHVRNGELSEVMVAFYQTKDRVSPRSKRFFEHADLRLQREPVEDRAYPNRRWNAILEMYCRNLKRAEIPFPTGALRCIEHFQKLGQNRLLLLCGDKAYRHEKELEEAQGPHLTPHGSFSTMVNADAIAKYFALENGRTFFARREEHTFSVGAFALLGDSKNAAPSRQLDRVFETEMSSLTPSDYINLFENLAKKLEGPNIATIIALLKLSNCDPDVFSSLEDALEETLPSTTEDQKIDLHACLREVWQHYYALNPDEDDVAFRLGRFVFSLGDTGLAQELFEFSLKHAGPHHATHFNIGLCFARFGKKKRAVIEFRKALECNPDYQPARRELKKLTTGKH